MFEQLQNFLKSPVQATAAWLKSQFKAFLKAIFIEALTASPAPVTGQAKQDTANQTRGAEKSQAAKPSPAPVMSAYEDTPPGKSFWDSPANDIRSWAEDVIRLQRDHDGAALGNLVDRLSSPDLTTLLKEVETTRTQNQAAKEKSAKEVREADKRRGTVVEASHYYDDYVPGPMRPGELSARGRERLSAYVAKNM